MAYKTFQNGFPLPASDLNTFLMNQTVIVFDGAANRTSTLPTPTEGMVTYLKDTNKVQYYTGAAWVDVNDNSDAILKSIVTTQGDLIVGTGSATVARLAKGTAGQVLTAGASTVSFETPTPAVPLSTVTTAGDLIVGTGSGAVTRIGIGADNQILKSNGTTAVWADATAAGQNFSQLASGSIPTTSSLQFTGLSGYDEIRILFYELDGNTVNDDLRMTINSDTGANYRQFGGFQSGNGTFDNTPIDGTSALNNIYLVNYGASTSSDVSGFIKLTGATTAGLKAYETTIQTDPQATADRGAISSGWYAGTATVSTIELNWTLGTFVSGGSYVVLGA